MPARYPAGFEFRGALVALLVLLGVVLCSPQMARAVPLPAQPALGADAVHLVQGFDNRQRGDRIRDRMRDRMRDRLRDRLRDRDRGGGISDRRYRPDRPRRIRPERPRPFVCVGGRAGRGICICPRGARRVRLGRNGFRCIGGGRPDVERPPEMVCVGGRVRRGTCVCPRGERRVRFGRRGFRCIDRPPVIDERPPIVCRGGRVRGSRCICPRGDRRVGSARAGFRCVERPPVVTPPKPPSLICRGGRVRGTRCVCPRGEDRVRLGRREFRCVPGEVVTPRPPRPDRPVVTPRPPRREIVRPRPPVAPRVPRVIPPLPVPRPPAPPQVAAVVIPELVADEVLFSVSNAEPQTLEDTIAAGLALEVIERQPIGLLGTRLVRLRIPDQRDVGTVVAALAADPRVGAPQPNYIYHRQQGQPAAETAEIDLSMQYGLVKLGVIEAHAVASGTGTRVAIIDSGVERTHDDLKSVAVEEFDAVAKDVRRQPAPPLGDPHGTAIAGIIAAEGVTFGVAPDSRILSVRAFSSGIAGASALSTTMRILKGLEWALENQARVVNMSFAGPRDGYMERAIAEAVKRGALVVAAAGNGGADARPAFPAAYPDVIAVTAIDTDDKLYGKANRGDYVAIAAPGVDIFAPALKNAHDVHSGTSFAAAYVSGVLALLLEGEPDLTVADARAALAAAARDLGAPGPDPLYGAGLVNAWSALEYRRLHKATAQ